MSRVPVNSTVPPDVDPNSHDVQTGKLKFKKDETIDPKSFDVRHHEVLITKEGHVDGRSKAVRHSDVLKIPAHGTTAEQEIDPDSTDVRRGFLQFNDDGSVKKACVDVIAGEIHLTKDGHVDMRSRAVRHGDVLKQQ